jgi:hypothetical protein
MPKQTQSGRAPLVCPQRKLLFDGPGIRKGGDSYPLSLPNHIIPSLDPGAHQTNIPVSKPLHQIYLGSLS